MIEQRKSQLSSTFFLEESLLFESYIHQTTFTWTLFSTYDLDIASPVTKNIY